MSYVNNSNYFNVFFTSILFAHKFGEMELSRELTVIFEHAQENSKSRQFTSAIKNYSKAIEINLKSWFSYWERGLVHGRNSEFTESMKDFSQVIMLYSENWEAYSYRSQIYKSLGKT